MSDDPMYDDPKPVARAVKVTDERKGVSRLDKLRPARPQRPQRLDCGRAGRAPRQCFTSFQDLGDNAGTDRLAAFADREAEALVHGDRLLGDQFDLHLDVVAGHAHFGLAAILSDQLGDGAGDVRGAEVELRPIAGEEGRMAAAFFLRQDVDIAFELGVRRDAAGLGEHLAALEAVALDAAEQDADVVAGEAELERLVEHLDARHDGLLGFLHEADDLDFVADLDLAALDTAGADRAAALDREHVFDAHQERLVLFAHGRGNVAVQGIEQVVDALAGGVVLAAALHGGQGAAADDRNLVARKLVLGEQLAQLQLDQFEQLGVVDRVDLVEEDDDARHTDLAGEQDVLAGLRHGPVVGGDDEDGAVHLSGAGDHVLDVVGVAGAIDVRVVAGGRLVFDVRHGDGDGLQVVALGAALGDLLVDVGRGGGDRFAL